MAGIGERRNSEQEEKAEVHQLLDMNTHVSPCAKISPAMSDQAGPSSPQQRAQAPLRPMSSLSTGHLEDIVRPICDNVSSTFGRRKKAEALYNWGGSFVCQPSATFSPTSVEHCCAIVELARRIGSIEVRAIGRSHSPGDVVFTRGWIVKMHALNGLIAVDVQAQTPSITVLGGTYVSDMHTMLELAEVPLAMKNVGSISEQTIAGLISTATHGTGIQHPVISAYTLSMRLVVALPEDQGGTQVIRCSRQENAELFNATLCGLGATGLIVEVKMEVDHWFKLKQIAEECSFDSLFGPSTGAPSIQARSPTSSIFDATENVAVQQASSRGDVASSDRQDDISPHHAKQKLSVGWLLAHKQSLLPDHIRRYPRTQRSTDPSVIFPHTPQETAVDLAAEQDDEATRSAQRHLEEIAASSQFVRMAWAPQAGMLTVMRMNRTLEPTQTPGLVSRIYGRVVGFHLLQLFFFLARYNSALPPKVNKAAYYLTHPSQKRTTPVAGPSSTLEDTESTDNVLTTMEQFSTGSSSLDSLKMDAQADDPKPIDPHNPTSILVDSSWRVFNVECLFRQYTNEWALPLSQAGAALRAMRDWLDEEERLSNGVRIHFPVEIRFAAADGIWLSPCHDRVTCYIGIVLYRPYNLPNKYRRLFSKYESLMRHFGGRPHWAKAHTCGPQELREMYPNLPDYLRVRTQYDPEGTFLNPYTRRHLLGHVSSDVSPRLFKSHL